MTHSRCSDERSSARSSASQLLLQDPGELVALGSSDFGIDTEVANLVVGWRMITVAFYRFNDGGRIVECSVPALASYSHSGTEITSRPPTVRMLRQADFPIRRNCIAGIGPCHICWYFTRPKTL